MRFGRRYPEMSWSSKFLAVRSHLSVLCSCILSPAPPPHSLPHSPDPLSITDCHVAKRTRPYRRLNCFYEKVKMEHKQVISDLQSLKNDNRDASEKFRVLTEEKGFY
ncbi:hypothetical protein STEG23_004558, partial [Scotinomys teguina]